MTDQLSDGIRDIGTIWRETLNSEGDAIWWRWTGKVWEHAHDNLVPHQDDQGDAKSPQ